MTTFTGVILGAAMAVTGLGLSAESQQAHRVPVKRATPAAPSTEASPSGSTMSVDAQNKLVSYYCSTCHDDEAKTGGLSLQSFDAARVAEHADVAEKMIRKLRTGMMPPPAAKERPDDATLEAFATALETTIDTAAALHSQPGSRPFQRLNRAEYRRAVEDLLGIDVDVTAFLPPDSLSQGFDNVADSQTFSPTLMEGYLRAAGRVTALALGDVDAQTSEAHYRVSKTASQLQRVDGAPLGTRGGLSVAHVFPADGVYAFRVDLHGNADGFLFGAPAAGEQLEVSIDGERTALLDIDPRMAEVSTGLSLKTPPVHVTAGSHRVTAAFIQRFEGPVNDLIAPISRTLADTQIGVAYGITTLPHLKDLSIIGPQRVTGVSNTATRRKIFSCRPTSLAQADMCAAQIVTRLATQAFRRPVAHEDFDGLMRFYQAGRAERGFEQGIAATLEAILASPQFLFRLEPAPALPPGAPSRQPRWGGSPGATLPLGDLELASRLSFFLWGAPPDADLRTLAAQHTLSTPAVLERQVKRMVAAAPAEALTTRFAAQWLRLHDVDNILPDAILYPYYDRNLGEDFVRETEMFFDSIVREDRSVLDLLTSDSTFVNERVARHYGIPNVSGSDFRRVQVPDYRRGILGHGSILVLTSVADRTSPVMRGKWIMEVLLGSPPPPPPPNVPVFEATKAAAAGKLLTVRERMEEHRKNPACSSCHRVIDPLGLALERFDATGKWRIKDSGMPVDDSGVMYDGTKLDGPAGLRSALLKHKDVFLQTFSENLMTYALGRRIEPYDMPAVRAIVRDAGRADYRFSAFVLGIVKSAAFGTTSAGAVETLAQEPRESRERREH
jgi:cytochrome c551/c552